MKMAEENSLDKKNNKTRLNLQPITFRNRPMKFYFIGLFFLKYHSLNL